MDNATGKLAFVKWLPWALLAAAFIVIGILGYLYLSREPVQIQYKEITFDHTIWDRKVDSISQLYHQVNKQNEELSALIIKLNKNEQQNLQRKILIRDGLSSTGIDSVIFLELLPRADSLRKAGRRHYQPPY
jgi:hypothetical protein